MGVHIHAIDFADEQTCRISIAVTIVEWRGSQLFWQQ
jgi:hypothetical protein